MARQDNPFSLLGEDDDGGDVAVFLAKVESKIQSPVALAEQSQPKPKGAASGAAANGFPSKPLPPAEYVRSERGRGRGSRGRAPGRGGFGSAGGGDGNFKDDSTGQFANRYPRDFGGDNYGRGRGRFAGGARGGRGRGRGRGYYEDSGYGNENQLEVVKDNQVRDGEWSEVRAQIPGDGYEVGDNRGSSFDNGHLGGGNRSSQWEERGYGGESRFSRGTGGRYGAGRGPRGGGGRRFGGRGGAGDEENAQMGNSHDTEVHADIKGLIADNAPIDSATSGGDVTEVTDAPKVVESDPKVVESEQVDSKNALSEKVPEEKVIEEEDKEMTLDEYEKLLTEKRKALESLKNQERKVVADEDFQRMQLIEKKKEEHFAKLKSEKDKLKKKDSFEKEEKVRKSLSINEFLKPAQGENYVGPAVRGRGGRGRGRGELGGYAGRGGRVVPAPHIEDPGQFPLLGVAVAAAIKA